MQHGRGSGIAGFKVWPQHSDVMPPRPLHSPRSRRSSYRNHRPILFKDSLPCGGLPFLYGIVPSSVRSRRWYAGVLSVLELHHLIIGMSVWQALMLMLQASCRGETVNPILCRAVFGVWHSLVLMQPDTVPPLRLWGSGCVPDMEADNLPTLPARFDSFITAPGHERLRALPFAPQS